MTSYVEHPTVCVRIRPLLENPDSAPMAAVTANDDGTSLRVVVSTEGNRKLETHSFTFDRSFGEHVTQEIVFDQCGVKQMVDAAMSGYACTAMCYGQTGSGKTYTMTGPLELDSAPAFHGMMQRVIHHVFSNNPGNLGLTVNVSYYEIYNEHVNDLIVVDESHANLGVRFNVDGQRFYVDGLIIVKCDTLEAVMAVVQEGMQNRKKSEHQVNKDSTRSHTIFTMYFDSKDAQGKINLIDLAGSERIKESASNIAETKSINKSLFTLGTVISALSEAASHPNHKTFIPYRDSVLTKLLMDSLGGNCKTLMIATVNPHPRFADESLNTLKYATRMAKMSIANTAPLARVRRTSIDHLKEELESLKRENAQLKIGAKQGVHLLPPGGSSEPTTYVDSAMQRQQDIWTKDAKLENERLRAENMRLRQHLYLGAGTNPDVITTSAAAPQTSVIAPTLRTVIPPGKVRRVSLTVAEKRTPPQDSSGPGLLGSVEVEALVTPFGVIQQAKPTKPATSGSPCPQVSPENRYQMEQLGSGRAAADNMSGCRNCADLVQSLRAENDRLLRALRELQLLGCGLK